MPSQPGTASPPLEQFCSRSDPRSARQSYVAGQQTAIEGFGQCHVNCIVRRKIAAELPDSAEQRFVGVTGQVEPAQFLKHGQRPRILNALCAERSASASAPLPDRRDAARGGRLSGPHRALRCCAGQDSKPPSPETV